MPSSVTNSTAGAALSPNGVPFSREVFPVGPLAVVRHFRRYASLIFILARAETIGRYKGTYLGVVWTILTPLMLLAAYSFVFGKVFKGTWDVADSKLAYTLPLYVSLITFHIFSEVASASPKMMFANRIFVTQIPFPLEVLPVVKTMGALFRSLPSYVVFAVILLLVVHYVPPTIVLLPIVVLPVCFFALGIGYLLSSVGAFIPDLAEPMRVCMRATLYVSAVVYPVSRLPSVARMFSQANPIARTMEATREVAIFGHWPDFGALAATYVGCLVFAWLSYLLFMASRSRFADAL